jgi:hypothetical protein
MSVVQTKAAVTIAEMARMVGLSRARFYQLKGKAFPPPLYDLQTLRPYYPEELQQVCLEVRRRNCGIDGKPILFYAKGPSPLVRKVPRATRTEDHGGLLDGLRSLGLSPVTNQEVNAAMKELFPRGTPNIDLGALLRIVFIHLKKRQNSADNVGR